jgi:hypothetical protein
MPKEEPKEYLEVNGQKYEVTGHADDGLPIIRGIATSTQDGFDDEGNPKISVNITVPSAPLVTVPGQNG